MSYDVTLVDPATKEPVRVLPHMEGGTVVLGGSIDADMNITYNYSKHIHAALGGLEELHGKTGRAAIMPLCDAVSMLGIDRDADYWKATPGNAGWALAVMLGWSIAHPDAVWEIS